ncbi:DUF4244 domain-containing protein [Acrocarpospora catenulata]|uniref:DUF4244 domain-containing protein n=1 Tax=Acrocarpospora catenulata TaxID=2836182 RepID=UPI0027DF146C|nr:DUF4244 domain-containing protein [Acrocarpospora catenulata]
MDRWPGRQGQLVLVEGGGEAAKVLLPKTRRQRLSLVNRARNLGVQWTLAARTRSDAGMSTAEYAVGTIAACGFAALLFKVVTSGEVQQMLSALVQKALNLAG